MSEKSYSDILSIHEVRQMLQAKGLSERTLNIPTGFATLDKEIENIGDGELYVISGETKNGKSLFGKSVSNNFSKAGESSVWFQFEEPYNLFTNSFDQVNPPSIFVPETLKTADIDYLLNTIRYSFENFGVRLFFIDHLHYIVDILHQKHNTSMLIGDAIRRLHLISVELRIAVFVFCHTEKNVDPNADLTFRNLRDSSFISQESDAVLLIKRYEENKSKCKLEFHRRTGATNLVFDMVKFGRYLMEPDRAYEIVNQRKKTVGDYRVKNDD